VIVMPPFDHQAAAGGSTRPVPNFTTSDAFGQAVPQATTSRRFGNRNGLMTSNGDT
jgi:hypothetical protein